MFALTPLYDNISSSSWAKDLDHKVNLWIRYYTVSVLYDVYANNIKCRLVLKCYNIHHSNPRKYIGRKLAASMDAKVVLILVSASICGTYRNRHNRMPTFRGNMADVDNIHEKSTEPDLSYYLNDYGIIGNDLLPSEDMRNEGIKFYIL